MSSPSAHVLFECYAGIVTPLLILALPLLVYLAPNRYIDAPTPSTDAGLRPWEAACTGLLALMPFSVFIAAFFIHLGFYNRYVILAVPGFAILFICTLHRLTNGSTATAGFLFKMSAWTCLLPWFLWQAVTIMAAPAPEKSAEVRVVAPARKDLPLVVADENIFLQDWLYRSSYRKQQFVVLIDCQAAARYTNNDTGQRSLTEARRLWPVPAIDYSEFVSRHSEFLLARLSVHADWIAQKLMADGAELRLTEIHRELGFLSPELQIFLVKVRPASSR